MLLIGAAQILFLDVPDHAAVDLERAAGAGGPARREVSRPDQCGAAARGARGPGLRSQRSIRCRSIRRTGCSRAGSATYGEETARAIAIAHGHEPPLDLTVKSDAESWAQRLRGRVLPTGTVRTVTQGQVALLPGYHEGAWWVQDAAAALPARLFGDVAGKHVADLCAAPGGKTAQLAQAGARVTAVDRSANRLVRVRENLARLGLAAEMIAADVTEWQGGPFDAVLVDAPCSSTGTIRRHPDVAWLKTEADIAQLVGLAAPPARPRGGAHQTGRHDRLLRLLARARGRRAADRGAAGARACPPAQARLTTVKFRGLAEFLNPAGDLRTLPCHWPDSDPRMGGLDGFFAARLERI